MIGVRTRVRALSIGRTLLVPSSNSRIVMAEFTQQSAGSAESTNRDLDGAQLNASPSSTSRPHAGDTFARIVDALIVSET